MASGQISQILANCLAIDTCAAKAYGQLARGAEDPRLRTFWQRMAEEEITHIGYWQRLKELADANALPQVFDDPSRVVEELAELADKARTQVAQAAGILTLKDAFILAYRLEFYMLHPAFERLFHTLRTAAGDRSPEDEYAEHIDSFVGKLAEHGHLTPEFELVSETLRHLWKENRKLAHQAVTDALTGILNRRGFFQVSEQLLHVAARRGETVAALMVDVDAFKEINDSLGHQQGDVVLRGVAQRLLGAVRASDVAARFGGEEFVVLLYGVDPDAVAAVAEKIRTSVADLAIEDAHVTVSIGASDCRVPTEADNDLQDLIRDADRRLYAAKDSGKNRAVTGD